MEKNLFNRRWTQIDADEHRRKQVFTTDTKDKKLWGKSMELFLMENNSIQLISQGKQRNKEGRILFWEEVVRLVRCAPNPGFPILRGGEEDGGVVKYGSIILKCPYIIDEKQSI